MEGVAAAGEMDSMAEAKEEGEESAVEEALRLPPPCPAGVALPASVRDASALPLGVALLPPSGPLVSEGSSGEALGGAEPVTTNAEGLALRLLVVLEEGVGARGVGDSVPPPMPGEAVWWSSVVEVGAAPVRVAAGAEAVEMGALGEARELALR